VPTLETKIARVHSDLARVVGQLSLILAAHRGMRRSLLRDQANSLRSAAAELDRLAEQDTPS
jgi:hypothetical protein